MKILFARHGESEANLQQIISNRDLPHHLTEKGISQASALAERLADAFHVKEIGTSPILRAKETAEIVGKRLGLMPRIYPVLREFDCGKMEGRSDDEAWAAYRVLTQAWDEDQDHARHIPPDGESFNDLKARFLPFIEEVAERKKELDGDILLITHGGLLYQILPLIIANMDRAFPKENPLGNCEFLITHPHNGKLICTNKASIS